MEEDFVSVVLDMYEVQPMWAFYHVTDFHMTGIHPSAIGADADDWGYVTSDDDEDRVRPSQRQAILRQTTRDITTSGEPYGNGKQSCSDDIYVTFLQTINPGRLLVQRN